MEHVRRHYKLLAHLLKNLTAERFKRMAKDEVLSKFISSRVDPALLIDHALHAEKEALDLAEMSLLKLVSPDHLRIEILKSAEKIQKSFEDVLSKDIAKDLSSAELLDTRAIWLATRVEFFRRWLSIDDAAETPLELGRRAFRSRKGFESSIGRMLEADKLLADGLVSATNPLHRFLMKKQMEHELKNSDELWEELKEEIFRTVRELPE